MIQAHAGVWPALLAVQGELGAVGRDAQADSGTRHRYASLPAVLAIVRPALYRAGLVLTQATLARPAEGLVEVVTRVVHAATGEHVECSVAVAPTTPTRRDGTPVLTEPQQVGVAITYARRYGVLCILGLPTDDTDGVAPAQVTERRAAPTPTPTPTTDGAAASDPLTAPAPSDIVCARTAALEALGARLRLSRDEVGRRLHAIAASDAEADPHVDAEASTRERLAEAMGRDYRGWRWMPDDAFAALLRVLERWPEGM